TQSWAEKAQRRKPIAQLHCECFQSKYRKVLYKISRIRNESSFKFKLPKESFPDFPSVCQQADFSSLRLTQLPQTGGDTLWASGYEICDRISKPYRNILEGLTAIHDGETFRQMARSGKFQIYEKQRGSPANVGDDLFAVHPVVRTNPITGWKSIFAADEQAAFQSQINGLTRKESANLLQFLHDMITHGHDLQVRFKWNQPNDIAIWDNRCVYR
ncbi:uncharacterized protein N7477_001061, partial [Penicillium maclennaniae]|uniref:uncharacterized protein n=1 Tax=Penicillium maclennaniae TaxID=1343394 RepID=UPI002540948D